MNFKGLDPNEVSLAASRLEASAKGLDGVTFEIDRLIRSALAHWQGPEAQDFSRWWVQQHRPRLASAAAGLHGGAANLRQQVAEQLGVSGNTGHRSHAAGAIQVPKGHRPGGGGPGVPPLPETEIHVKGKHTFAEGEHTEYSPAPGSVEATEQNHVEGEATLDVTKGGIAIGAAGSATAIAAHSRNKLEGPGGTKGELNYDTRIGADAKAGAKLGSSGGSVDAQAMVGVSAGVDGSIGNDDARVGGKAEVIGGIGVETHGHAKIEDGKLKIGVKGGAAFLVGAKLGVNVEIDAEAPKRIVTGAANAFGRMFWRH